VPADLTIFAAKYLVFIAVVVAAAILAFRLWQLPRLSVLQWVVAAVVLLVLSYALALAGGAAYNDPRPFTTSHVAPLISHAPDNGFPSDHALLAAALVALVAMVDVLWAIPLAVIAVMADWARVGAGIHHVVDVAGSSIFVAIAAVIALVIAPIVMGLLTPHLPEQWKERRLMPDRRPR
jgi:membrane-associated phospholipid phosphatase